jgi:predicted regulator of Ras-like GTPase activity (Roadblock/LC7/MglB family)
MVNDAARWTLTPEDEAGFRRAMERLLYESGAHYVMLVDRGGQLLSELGERPPFDATSFATLAAADFSANDQLARLLGEGDFTSLFHQGEQDSMLLSDIGGRAILVVVFGTRTTLGLVRLRARAAVDELTALVTVMSRRDGDASVARPALFADADDEIDQLFR